MKIEILFTLLIEILKDTFSISNFSFCIFLQKNQLEQLCVNLCAETIQHFYNTYIFKSTMQALKDEDIQTEVEVRYLDNEPILELLTSQV